MYALIQKTDNRILRVAADGAELSGQKPFYWRPCPDEVTPQWVFTGEIFEPPSEPAPSAEQLSASIRAERDRKIADVAWRYERIARQERLDITPTDNIAALDAYVQALADVPLQATFPQSVTWPEVPV